jgi:hypothetical protein
MRMGVLTSVAVLVVAAIAGFLIVRLVLKRLRAGRTIFLFVAVLWVAVVVGILFLDVNIPLTDSSYRPEGTAAPVWLAVLVMFSRFAALASIWLASAKLRSSRA